MFFQVVNRDDTYRGIFSNIFLTNSHALKKHPHTHPELRRIDFLQNLLQNFGPKANFEFKFGQIWFYKIHFET